MEQITIEEILRTYECVISCRTHGPKTTFEEAFSDKAVDLLKEEYKWLQSLANTGTKEKPQETEEEMRHWDNLARAVQWLIGDWEAYFTSEDPEIREKYNKNLRSVSLALRAKSKILLDKYGVK